MVSLVEYLERVSSGDVRQLTTTLRWKVCNDRNQVLIERTSRVTHRERIFCDRLYRPPKVDDSPSSGTQLLANLRIEVFEEHVLSTMFRKVDMNVSSRSNLLNRSTVTLELRLCVDSLFSLFSRVFACDVGEYTNAFGTGAIGLSVFQRTSRDNTTYTSLINCSVSG